MKIEEKIALLEDIMDLDEGTLTLETVLAELEEWDSMTKLSLVASVKKAGGEDLTVEDIAKFKTVADICSVIES